MRKIVAISPVNPHGVIEIDWGILAGLLSSKIAKKQSSVGHDYCYTTQDDAEIPIDTQTMKWLRQKSNFEIIPMNQQTVCITPKLKLNFDRLRAGVCKEDEKGIIPYTDFHSQSAPHAFDPVRTEINKDLQKSDTRISSNTYIFEKDRENPGHNSAWHFDHASTYTEDFKTYFTYIYNDVRGKKGPKTKYIKTKKTLLIPLPKHPSFMDKADQNRDLFSMIIDDLLDSYTEKLIEKKKLKVKSLPMRKVVKVSRCFLHRSPKVNEFKKADRIFFAMMCRPKKNKNI